MRAIFGLKEIIPLLFNARNIRNMVGCMTMDDKRAMVTKICTATTILFASA